MLCDFFRLAGDFSGLDGLGATFVGETRHASGAAPRHGSGFANLSVGITSRGLRSTIAGWWVWQSRASGRSRQRKADGEASGRDGRPPASGGIWPQISAGHCLSSGVRFDITGCLSGKSDGKAGTLQRRRPAFPSAEGKVRPSSEPSSCGDDDGGGDDGDDDGGDVCGDDDDGDASSWEPHQRLSRPGSAW
ncbi:hypothetical protein MJ8_31360 [Mesorhizobium sp. J8]|nr:hypothetical protein MJ8_31360 [Mesorhizobium sp. J8]